MTITKRIVPPIFFDIFYRIKSIIVSIFNSPKLSSNKKFKDAFKDEECFILATGPSINSLDTSKLTGKKCITVSNFFVHKKFNDISPFVHFFAASHPPITPEAMGAWLTDAEKKIPSSTSIFLSLTDKAIVTQKNIFPKHNTGYYFSSKGGNWDFDFTKPLPPSYTVVHLALYFAIYSGFKKVYLLGVDHSWVTHYGKSKHFYQEDEHKLNQQGYNEWFNINLLHQFYDYINLWKTYLKIRQRAAKRSVEIINLTPGSLLDVFPRSSLEKV